MSKQKKIYLVLFVVFIFLNVGSILFNIYVIHQKNKNVGVSSGLNYSETIDDKYENNDDVSSGESFGMPLDNGIDNVGTSIGSSSGLSTNSYTIPHIEENLTYTIEEPMIRLVNPENNPCSFKYEIHINDFHYFIGTDCIAAGDKLYLNIHELLDAGSYNATIVIIPAYDDYTLFSENIIKVNTIINIIK